MNQDKKLENKIIFAAGIFIAVIAVLLWLPAIQNMLLSVAESFIGRQLRRPEKWIGMMKQIGIVLPVGFSVVAFFNANRIQSRLKNIYDSNPKKIEFACAAMAFAVLAFVYTFRCTESSLWYDEGIEYWVSKSLSGIAYGGALLRNLPNMYERICATVQPPLYNFLMFLWLKICDTEFWFKFFGVPCFLLGNIAFYLTCKEFTNKITSCALTLIFGTSHIFIYYAHEAAEYTCLFCFICWLTLYFVRSLKCFSWKNLILYFTFATLSIYSQYGACFVISGTAAVLLIHNFCNSDSESRLRDFIKLSIPGLVSVIVFVVPLFYFFTRRQLLHTVRTNNHTPTFEYGNMIVDYLTGLEKSASFFYNTIVIILAAVFIFSMVIRNIIQKQFTLSLYGKISIATFIAWTMYYFAVRCNIYKMPYSSGFGMRWGMAFCSLFGILIVCSFINFYEEFKRTDIKRICSVFFLLLGLWLFMSNTISVINSHDIKCHVREAYRHLNENEIKPILVEQWYLPTLSFYILHDNNSNIDISNIYDFEYEKPERLNKQFGELLSHFTSDSFYYLCGHKRTNQDTVETLLFNLGYTIEERIQFDKKILGNPTILKLSKIK